MKKGKTAATDIEMYWRKWWDDPSNDHLYAVIVDHYVSEVQRIAKNVSRAVRNRMPQGDLVSAGMIGLHKAVMKYAEGDVDFPAFSYKYIRCAMYEEMRSLDPLSRRQRRIFRMILDMSRLLAERTGKTPTYVEIAEQLDLSPDEVEIYIGMGSAAIDIDTREGEGLSLLERLPCESPSPEDHTHHKLALELLYAAICNLDEDEQIVIRSRTASRPVSDIAGELSVTPGRVSQVYNEAIDKLRDVINPKKKRK